MESDRHQLFQRYEANPILVAEDWPYTVNAVFNPGVVRHEDDTVLLVRVEDRSGLSHLSVARSKDGYTDWRIDQEPSFVGDATRFEEAWGVEDPRITRCGDEYMIVYTGFSHGGPLVCLASTRNFQTFERRGVLMVPEDKDAALFPCTFEGRWGLIHRPVAGSGMARVGAHIWLSWSPDLRHWGDHKVLIHARQGGWWDANKVGLSPPPLLTKYGWLLMYHGVRVTASGSIYRLGLALLDGENPGIILIRGNEWIFGPERDYERSGDVPDVVFPCGWLLDDDQQSLRLYYGAADTSICVATADLDRLIDYLHRHCICGSVHPIGYSCDVAASAPIDLSNSA